MLFAFEMTLEIAGEFYRRCTEQNAETEKERCDVLIQMVEEGLIKNVTATERSKKQYVEDMKKNFRVWEPGKGEKFNEI